MCGRMFQTLSKNSLLQIAKTNTFSNDSKYIPSYNMCPTNHIPAIVASKNHLKKKCFQTQNQYTIERLEYALKTQQKIQGNQLQVKQQSFQQKQKSAQPPAYSKTRTLNFMKWGFTDKRNFFIINARLQQLLEKKMFVDIIENRCVVIMQGYYEWNSKKEPFSIRQQNGDNLFAAALYTQQEQIVLLTKAAIEPLAKVHDRMPVLLTADEIQVWIDPKNTKNIANIIQTVLLKKEREETNEKVKREEKVKIQQQRQVKHSQIQEIAFTISQLGPHVNSVKDKSDKCLMTLEQHKQKNGLMRFWGKNKNQDKGTVKIEQEQEKYNRYPQQVISDAGQVAVDKKSVPFKLNETTRKKENHLFEQQFRHYQSLKSQQLQSRNLQKIVENHKSI